MITNIEVMTIARFCDALRKKFPCDAESLVDRAINMEMWDAIAVTQAEFESEEFDQYAKDMFAKLGDIHGKV